MTEDKTLTLEQKRELLRDIFVDERLVESAILFLQEEERKQKEKEKKCLQ